MKNSLQGGLYTGYIETIFTIWFISMGSKTLLVCIYRPIGTYLVQEKVMQGQTLGVQKIKTSGLKWWNTMSCFIKPFRKFKARGIYSWLYWSTLLHHHHLLHHQKKIEYRVWALPLAFFKIGRGAPVSYHLHYLLPLLILVWYIVTFWFRWIKV